MDDSKLVFDVSTSTISSPVVGPRRVFNGRSIDRWSALTVTVVATILIIGPGCSGHRFDSSLAHRGAINQLTQTTTHSTAKPPIHTLNPDETLADVIRQSDGSTIVDFYADWCGPCKRQGKLLNSIQATLAGANAQVIKVNVDKFPELKQQYQVSGLPTLVLVNNGKVVDRSVGLTNESTISRWIR